MTVLHMGHIIFEPLLVNSKMLTRAIHKGEIHCADKLVENKPVYTLDHVIKERCTMMWKITVMYSLIIS